MEYWILNVNGLAINATLNTKITEIENKIPDTTRLVIKTSFNVKVMSIENKMPNIKVKLPKLIL